MKSTVTLPSATKPVSLWTSFKTISDSTSSFFEKNIKIITGISYTPLSKSTNKRDASVKKYRCYRFINSKIRFFLIETFENFKGLIKIINISPLKSWKRINLDEELCCFSKKIFFKFIKDIHCVQYFLLGHNLNTEGEGLKFSFSCVAILTDLENSPIPLKVHLFQDHEYKLHFLQIDRL